jgi:RHS repeat-associated protein
MSVDNPVGNRLSLTSTLAGIAAQTNTFDGNDRLVADTFDANGNTLASGGNTFAYEFEDRLTNYNAGAITYLYDGDGNRVARTETGSTTRFLIDTLTPIGYAQVAEEVVAGFVVRQYTRGLMRVSQRQNISGTWTTSYYGYDGFLSTRQLLDGAGVVTATFAFDGFANLVARTGTTPNQYLYRGEALDAGTGMYYLRARWYRPGVGRFLTEDLYEGDIWQPSSLHLYGYAEADPIKGSDPSGFARNTVGIGNIVRQVFSVFNTNMRSVTLGKVKAGAQTAFDAICCLDKAWSVLDLALCRNRRPQCPRSRRDC